MAKKQTSTSFQLLKKYIEYQVSKSEKEKTINFSVRLSRSLYDNVRKDAEAHSCTASDVVRAVLTKEYH